MRRGWHSRGYLPHYDDDETTQFVTFRLGDAVPPERLAAWRLELWYENARAQRTSVALIAQSDKHCMKGRIPPSTG